MSRLIDADVLKKAITQNREIDRNAVCDVLDIIDNAPTVEPYQGEAYVNIKMSDEDIKQFKQMLQENTPLYMAIREEPTVEPKLSDEQINKITDLLETEWGYKGIREDVSRILRGGRE